MGRPAIVIALPPAERIPVSEVLQDAGFVPIRTDRLEELEAVLESRSDVAVAIIDAETDFDASLELYAALHESGRDIPALMVVSPRTLDNLGTGSSHARITDEYFTRPYSVESLRWRVEAMVIRSQTVDDGSGDVLASGPLDNIDWASRAKVIVVFNPKGGVGKTSIAVNLAAALQIKRDQNVLLVDADTVTGHIASSLGIDQIRTVVDSWRDEDESASETFADVAAAHPSGVQVVVLASSPLHTEVLVPERVANAIGNARRGHDFVIVDMHPDYGDLNLAIFERADRIIVPVTPDVPAIRAAVQCRDVFTELGLRERLSLVINRANSGVTVADLERTVGMPALAEIRSAGLVFVRAANEGRMVVERFPREKVTEDFDRLAAKLLGAHETAPSQKPALQGLFGRSKEQPVHA